MEPIQFIDRNTQEVITENPPGEAFLKFLYYNPFGKLSLEAFAKRKLLTSLYGRLMDSPGSRKRIQPFIDAFQIDMEEAEKEVEAFESFNDFFYRKLKASARPIAEGFVSPADGKLIAFEKLEDIGEFFVKGDVFTLKDFLQDDALAAKYRDGSMLIVRLAPNDYHRFHFPYGGTPSPTQRIRGSYYSVSPYAVMANFGRVFCENKREYLQLSSPDKGDILLCPVGATMVGSIIETYTPEQPVNKGDEMGYFAFGGSSVVILVEKGKLSIDPDLLENTSKGMETAVIMGEKIGS
jgi:phosphatidylserine decarboxylase